MRYKNDDGGHDSCADYWTTGITAIMDIFGLQGADDALSLANKSRELKICPFCLYADLACLGLGEKNA